MFCWFDLVDKSVGFGMVIVYFGGEEGKNVEKDLELSRKNRYFAIQYD